MPYQSSRNKYRSRRERKQENERRTKLIIWGLLALGFFFILKDWRDYLAYFKTFFMD